MNEICPSCGYDMQRDTIYASGPWRIIPREAVYYNGVCITLSPARLNILLVLARQGGRTLSPDALLNRVSDSEDNNVVASQISQMRRYFEQIGIPFPIIGSRAGYRWSE